MAAKPTTVPRWARTAGGADAANIATPTSGESDSGYTNGQNPVSSSKTNWLFNWLYKWILYLQDAAFVATAASGLAGVTGTGDAGGEGGRFTGGASAPGVAATAGGGGAPLRGAVSLNSQTTPSGPLDGDIWDDSAANALRGRYWTTTVWISKWLHFSGLAGSVASTVYHLAATAASSAAAGTAGVLGLTQYVVPAGRAIVFGIKTSTTTAGGTITIQLVYNSTTVGSIVLTAGSVAGWYKCALISGNLGSIPDGATLEVFVSNGTGVTTGVGQVVAYAELA